MAQINTFNEFLISHSLSSFYDIYNFFMQNFEIYGLTIKYDENLYIVSYSSNVQLITDKWINMCRGLILEKETNKIVCYTFDKSIEYSEENIKLFTVSLAPADPTPAANQTIIEESIDGTQIRLYYYNNKWNYATTRCIDAKKNRFNNTQSFYELFSECDIIDYTKLDITKCYALVMCHPNNRIVAKYNTLIIYHVLTRDLITMNLCHSDDIGIKKPTRVFFDNYDELYSSLNNIPYFIEGFVLKDNVQIMKLQGVSYKYVASLRNNKNLALLYNYLLLKNENLVGEILKYYDEFTDLYNEFEYKLDFMIKMIYYEYQQQFIYKQLNFIPSTYYKGIIRLIHSDYMETRQNTSLEKVSNIVYSVDTAYLCYLFNNRFTYPNVA